MTRYFSWLHLSVFFSAGVLLLAAMPALPTLWQFALSGSLALLCLVSRRFWLNAVGVALLGLVWACGVAQWQMSRWLPEALDDHEIEITGTVLDFPRKTDEGWQWDFYSDTQQGKLRLSLYDRTGTAVAPRFDCHYRLRVKLRRPRGLINNGQFDYQLWLLQAGYLATGYVREVLDCEPQPPGLLTTTRIQIAGWIAGADLSDEARATLLGLLIGSYAGVDTEQWQVWRDSGTIHLLSVSGLHIALVAGLVYWLMLRLTGLLVFPLRWLPAQFWAAGISFGFAAVYALLAGFSVATQRSLIMVGVAVMQSLLYGRFVFGSSLLLSFFLVVLLAPLSIFSVGFWFSFWATAVLLLAGYGRQRLPHHPLLVLVVESCRLQWLLLFAVAPLMLYVYGRLTLVSLPMNLLAVPWASFLSLPLGLLACLVHPFSHWSGELLMQWSGWTLDIFWQVMRFAVDHGRDWHISLGVSDLLAALLGLLGVCLLCLAPPGLPLRCFGCLLCLPLLFPRDIRLPDGAVEASFLDVGQGLAVIVRTAGHVLVYDTGDHPSERFDAGRDIVAPALRNLHVNEIDMLVLSHSDSDHSGGARGLLAMIPARQLWSGTPEQLSLPEPVLPCRAGMHWRWDGVDFQVLNPGMAANDKDNNRSCVLLVDNGLRRILLTGDIEATAEQRLLDGDIVVKADVLQSPHHGSKTSSSPGFVRAVGAGLAVITSGHANRFHHPHASVLARYRNNGLAVLNTARSGAVTVRLTPDGLLQWQTGLCTRPVFWRNERYTEVCNN